VLAEFVLSGASKEPLIKVVGVRPLDGHRLWLRFSNNEERVFDCSPLLEFPVYRKIIDAEAFASVYLDYGVPTWLDGSVDIAPGMLYERGTACQEAK